MPSQFLDDEAKPRAVMDILNDSVGIASAIRTHSIWELSGKVSKEDVEKHADAVIAIFTRCPDRVLATSIIEKSIFLFGQ